MLDNNGMHVIKLKIVVKSMVVEIRASSLQFLEKIMVLGIENPRWT